MGGKQKGREHESNVFPPSNYAAVATFCRARRILRLAISRDDSACHVAFDARDRGFLADAFADEHSTHRAGRLLHGPELRQRHSAGDDGVEG